MVKEKQNNASGSQPDLGCCRVEAIVSVDERGQVVLPKELRAKAGIKAGDKLAVASWSCGENVQCLFILKADALAGMVKNILGPALNELIK